MPLSPVRPESVEATVALGVRRIDPDHGVDEVVDVLIADGKVARLGLPGDATSWPEAANALNITSEIDAEPGTLILCPGLVDLHTHFYGSVGVPDIDQVGVRSGVPTIVDAGGAGALSIDDFVAQRSLRARTRTLAFLSAEAAGITESSRAHSTGKAASQMETASLNDFLGAIDRHADRVVGLKVWASARAGISWVDHVTNLSEMATRPLMVHVGEIDPQSTATPITGDVLDRLQGGDIVTHCFTGLPGALVDERHQILSEVQAARGRGVQFDTAPGMVNLRFDRAIAAMEQGWLPDVISSDVHRFALDQPDGGSLISAMNTFLALGMSLRAVIERASLRPADLIATPTGRPEAGQPATLSLLRLHNTPRLCSDGHESIHSTEWLEPVGCFLDGTWFDASNERPVEEPSPLELTTDIRMYLQALSNELTHLREHEARWRGIELHSLVHRARIDCGVPVAPGLDAFYQIMIGASSGPAAGWLLEELGPVASVERLSEVLASP